VSAGACLATRNGKKHWLIEAQYSFGIVHLNHPVLRLAIGEHDSRQGWCRQSCPKALDQTVAGNRRDLGKPLRVDVRSTWWATSLAILEEHLRDHVLLVASRLERFELHGLKDTTGFVSGQRR